MYIGPTMVTTLIFRLNTDYRGQKVRILAQKKWLKKFVETKDAEAVLAPAWRVISTKVNTGCQRCTYWSRCATETPKIFHPKSNER